MVFLDLNAQLKCVPSFDPFHGVCRTGFDLKAQSSKCSIFDPFHGVGGCVLRHLPRPAAPPRSGTRGPKCRLAATSCRTPAEKYSQRDILMFERYFRSFSPKNVFLPHPWLHPCPELEQSCSIDIFANLKHISRERPTVSTDHRPKCLIFTI